MGVPIAARSGVIPEHWPRSPSYPPDVTIRRSATYLRQVAQFAFTPVRLAVAAVVIGVAISAALWVVTYRQPNPWYGPAENTARFDYHPFVSPAWTRPVAAVIGIAAVGAAGLVLRRR